MRKQGKSAGFSFMAIATLPRFAKHTVEYLGCYIGMTDNFGGVRKTESESVNGYIPPKMIC